MPGHDLGVRPLVPGGYSSQTQVLVVGAGPAGLVTALVLARYGIDVLLVDKRHGTSSLSRALVVSTRSMELLRSWGLEERVRAGAADVQTAAWVSRTLASRDGSSMSLGYPTDEEVAGVSPTRPAWAPQDHVEPLLLALLRSRPSALVRFGVTLVRLEHGEGALRAVLHNAESDAVEHVEATYVVGADGAHSAVRTDLGIAMEGSDDLGEYHRVEFRAPLAGVVGERRYGLYVIIHPDAEGVLAPRGPTGRWGFTREWRPGQDRLVDHPPDELVTLIRTATGVPGLDVQLEQFSSFTFAAQLAQRYADRGCFLVGDAAHRMTPRGGTGMNTAIQDAFNLGWKLAWVLRGWAGSALLESYERERRPIGQHNVGRSAQPGGARQEAAQALEWDLGGRLAHHWLQPGRVSTLDLVGDGLTLLTGPRADGWETAVAGLRTRVPVVSTAVDAAAAEALELGATGAVLVRPDALPVARWSAPVVPLVVDGLHVT